ncbi:MAG: hypothetical protein AAB462_03815 [Patescibacteria group bacterium]
MSELIRTVPYSFRDVVHHNFKDALRYSGGAEGFSTLTLINPDREDGPPVSAILPSDCNEESRLMLQQLYATMGIDPSAATQEETGSKGDDRSLIGYERIVYHVSPIYGVKFTEIYRLDGEIESFRVWAEPNSTSGDYPMTSPRNN